LYIFFFFFFVVVVVVLLLCDITRFVLYHEMRMNGWKTVWRKSR